MLEFIVKANARQRRKTLRNCMAISLRTDGSVHRMQIHNDHLQAKIIHPDASDSLYFLGFGESEDPGAKGYLAAIKQACQPLSWDDVLIRTSSLVTDGENMNTGAKNGLWVFLFEERLQSSSYLPLQSIWHGNQLPKLFPEYED
eukprot:gene8302-9186_t